MNVPFIDVQRLSGRFQSEFEAAFCRVSRSGRYLFGEETASFEREFAEACGAVHCVGMASGLDALSITLEAWISLGRMSPGDEVIVPANSFVASALAVTRAGLRLRFADVDPDTFNVTRDTVAAAMTERVRAIMPVHLYGQLVNIDALKTLTDELGLPLLEDAAQAHGARDGSGRSRKFGDAAGFSFYPTKNLGALGDAGCVITNDDELAERVRVLGNYGASHKYKHEFRGTNSRIDELQSALLRVRLVHLDADNEKRRDIARRYIREISHPLVKLPSWPVRRDSHVWHLFVITTPQRDSLIEHLRASDIETMVHYPCSINRQPAFSAEFGRLVFPVSDRLQEQVLSLPMSPVLDQSQVDCVIGCINSWAADGGVKRAGLDLDGK